MVCMIWCFATGSVRHWERAVGRLAGWLFGPPIVCRVIIGSGCSQSREDKCSGEMSFGWVLVHFLKGIAVDSKRRRVYPMPHTTWSARDRLPIIIFWRSLFRRRYSPLCMWWNSVRWMEELVWSSGHFWQVWGVWSHGATYSRTPPEPQSWPDPDPPPGYRTHQPRYWDSARWSYPAGGRHS